MARGERATDPEPQLWSELLAAMPELRLAVADADGTIRAWSRGAEQLTGVAAAAALGAPLARVLGVAPLDLAELAAREPPRHEWSRARADGGARRLALCVRALGAGSYALRLEPATGEPPPRWAEATRDAQLVCGVGDGAWDWTLATGEDVLSPRWKALLGFGPDELADREESFFSRIHPSDVDRTRAAVAAHLEHDAPYDVELRLRTRSGEYRWFRARGVARRDSDGVALGMAGTITDITDRKLAELEVQRLNADLERRVRQHTGELRRFMTVIEASTDFIGIADLDGRLLYLNHAFRDALGPHPRGDLWSTRVGELYPAHMAARLEREARPQAMRAGHWLGESELRRFDGTTIPVSQLLLAHYAPTGELEYFSTIMRDVTRQRQLEAELRWRAERLAVAAAAGKVGIWDWNVLDDTLVWDAVMYALYGVDRDQFAGVYEAWQSAVYPDDRDRFDDAIRRALRDELAFDTEFRVVWPDGSVHTIRAHGVVHRDAEGTPVRMLGTNWDITDIKRAEAEIRTLNDDLRRRAAEVEASNQELEAFSYTVSHDLRAPLRAIEGYSRIVLEDFGDTVDPEVVDYLRDIRRNTLQMGRLVDDLLAFSRLGRQTVSKRAIAVDAIVAQCLEELRPRRDGRDIAVRVGDLPPCVADRRLLKQVWFNLLDNALKYSSKREHAVIEIEGETRATETIYSVKDNGVGFDMRYAGKLFGVFQRLHRPEDYEGTGVGLAIVHRMIHRHGGRVWAEAQPDVGATFFFALPTLAGGAVVEHGSEPR